jgi:hypothetical protein
MTLFYIYVMTKQDVVISGHETKGRREENVGMSRNVNYDVALQWKRSPGAPVSVTKVVAMVFVML